MTLMWNTLLIFLSLSRERTLVCVSLHGDQPLTHKNKLQFWCVTSHSGQSGVSSRDWPKLRVAECPYYYKKSTS